MMPVAKSTLSRAEVTADFLIWRASGQYDLKHSGNRWVDRDRAAYRQAEAMYADMRKSPQFAALVEQIIQGGPTRVVLASR